ncbi:MAG TPA: hypothetical protein VFL57_01290 [Bryobacteraceae bacterium]|nr:hypothetical protein [Bryobacteraceae bacterium]
MRVPTAACIILLAVYMAASPASGAFFGRPRLRSSTSSNLTLRKRLHVNTLIAEPGTGELDWGSWYSVSTTNFSMPSALRYTPQGRSVPWGRTEYSIAFDSFTNAEIGGRRLTQFSESLIMTATSVLFDGERLDVAIAPQLTAFLRDESGLRAGAIAIARYDVGRNSVGVTAGWSGATHNSPSNPSGTFDAGFGLGRRLAGSGILGRFTPHFNGIWEKSTGQARIFSAFEGVEYQTTDRLAFDLSGQHFAIRSASPDHQLVFGLTFSFGKSR